MPTIAKSVCPECGGWKKVESPRCKFCSHKRSCKVERPSMAELGKMVETIPMTSIASKYGVSGTAVKKWCVSYGIKISNRLGYWAKKRSVTETI